MKLTTTLLAIGATLSTLTEGCLRLKGVYYTGNQHMQVTLSDNGAPRCSWAGTFRSSSVNLNCVDGVSAWIRQPSWPERAKWDAGYSHSGQDFKFTVNSAGIISAAGRIIGHQLWADNYGC